MRDRTKPVTIPLKEGRDRSLTQEEPTEAAPSMRALAQQRARLDAAFSKEADSAAAELDEIENLLDILVDRLRAVPASALEGVSSREKHERLRRLLEIGSGDPVQREIDREVTIRWGDRKLPMFADTPWTANPVLFVSHVFKKWHSNGVLERKHLRADPDLYHAYSVYIGRHPELALSLRTDARAKHLSAEEAGKRTRQKAAARARAKHGRT